MTKQLKYYRSIASVLRYILSYKRFRPVVFYNRYILHTSFSMPIIEQIAKHEKVVVFFGDKNDPALQSKNDNILTLFLDYRYEHLFSLISADVFITPATTFYAKNKPKNSHLIHQFHSLVSINHIYTPKAFDGYDGFFSAGEHHTQELQIYQRLRRWPKRHIYTVGYPKILSLLKQQKQEHSTTKTILLAPSWGTYNLFRLHGVAITKMVLEAGYNIIVRPHSHSYNNDHDIVEQLRAIERQHPNRCRIENANTAPSDSLKEADLMISDWSGVAYEYAFSFLKPVLFVDIPQKINNPDTTLRDAFVPMEMYLRDQIGIVTSIENLKDNLTKLLHSHRDYHDKIKTIRDKYLYNIFDSDVVGAKIAMDIRNKML